MNKKEQKKKKTSIPKKTRLPTPPDSPLSSLSSSTSTASEFSDDSEKLTVGKHKIENRGKHKVPTKSDTGYKKEHICVGFIIVDVCIGYSYIHSF